MNWWQILLVGSFGGIIVGFIIAFAHLLHGMVKP